MIRAVELSFPGAFRSKLLTQSGLEKSKMIAENEQRKLKCIKTIFGAFKFLTTSINIVTINYWNSALQVKHMFAQEYPVNELLKPTTMFPF